MRSGYDLLTRINNNAVQYVSLNEQIACGIDYIPNSIFKNPSFLYRRPGYPDQVVLVETYDNQMNVDATLSVWDVSKKSNIIPDLKLDIGGMMSGHIYPLTIALLPNSKRLAFCHSGGIISFVNLDTLKEEKAIKKNLHDPAAVTTITAGEESTLVVSAVKVGKTYVSVLKDGVTPYPTGIGFPSGAMLKPFDRFELPIKATSLQYKGMWSYSLMTFSEKEGLLRWVKDENLGWKKVVIDPEMGHGSSIFRELLPIDFSLISNYSPDKAYSALPGMLIMNDIGTPLWNEGGSYTGVYPPIPFQLDTAYEKIKHIHPIEMDRGTVKLLLIETCNHYTNENQAYFIKPGYTWHPSLGKIKSSPFPNPSALSARLTWDQYAVFNPRTGLGARTFYNMEGYKLNDVLNKILTSNTSIKWLDFNDVVLDEKGLEIVYQLKKNKPNIQYQYSTAIGLQLAMKAEEEKIANGKLLSEKDALIAQLQQTLSSSNQEGLVLNQQAVLTAEQKNILNAKKVELDQTKQKLSHELEKARVQIEHLKKQKEIESALIKEKEEKFAKESNEHQENINELKLQLSIVTQDLSQSLDLSSRSQIASVSLIKQLEKENDILSPEIVSALIDRKEDITDFNLIRWSEQPSVLKEKDTLINKGAILSVDDLQRRVKEAIAIQVNESPVIPLNETPTIQFKPERVDFLTKGIEKLLLDYDAKKLPPSALESLNRLVIPDIEQAIQSKKPDWLYTAYSTQLDRLRRNLIEEYFKKISTLQVDDLMILNKQFQTIIQEEFLIQPRYKHYVNLLNDGKIIEKIRNNDPAVSVLSTLIKAKMKLCKMESSVVQHNQAIQTMLHNPSSLMQRFLYDTVIEYWDKLKQTLHPLMPELLKLRSQINKTKDSSKPNPLDISESAQQYVHMRL